MQTERVLELVESTYPGKVLKLVTRASSQRKSAVRTCFLRVLSGCDFMTPFSYRKAPKCVHCGQEKVRIEHLLFECPKVPNQKKYLDDYKNAIAIDKCSDLADRLLGNNCYKLLLKLFFGLVPTDTVDWDHPLVRWKFNDTPNGKRVLKVTARILYEIREYWESATELVG